MRQRSSTEPSGVVLRRESGRPIYLQVVDQLRYLIAAGRFRVGSYLPPMRQVADELGLNLNTVLRAYAELQRDGLIQSTRGKGAVVVRVEADSSLAVGRPGDGAQKSIDAMISAAVEYALSAGLDPSEVLARTQAALESVGRRAPTGPTIGVLATPSWRAGELADALRSAGIGRVRAISDASSSHACDLVVRPLFGALDAPMAPVGAPTLDVAMLLDRACVRELLEIDANAPVVIVAADERAAIWLADAVAGFAGAAKVQRVVASSLDEVDLGHARIIVIEKGLPRGSRDIGALSVIQARAVFPASIAEAIEARRIADDQNPDK